MDGYYSHIVVKRHLFYQLNSPSESHSNMNYTQIIYTDSFQVLNSVIWDFVLTCDQNSFKNRLYETDLKTIIIWVKRKGCFKYLLKGC